MTLELTLLTQRVERLERQNQYLKRIAVATGLTLGALLLMAAEVKPRTIEAEKIILLDSHVRPRATIGTPEFAGVAIDTKPDEPVIWLSDENGTDRATLSTDGLRLNNAHAKPLVELRGDVIPGRSGLSFYSSDGKISWSAP